MARLIIGLLLSMAVWAQPLQDVLKVTRIYDIQSMTPIDNRSTATRANNLHTFFCSGTGVFTCQLQYSSVSLSGPWVDFAGSQSLITQTSTVPNGLGYGYYPYIRIYTTGTITRVDYAGVKDIWLGGQSTAIGATWGYIAGTLSNQTDLNSALAGKASTSHVHAATDVTSAVLDSARLGLSAGAGIAISGAQIGVDNAIIPYYSLGAGVPTAACTAGQETYLNTTAHTWYYCSQTDTWSLASVTTNGTNGQALTSNGTGGFGTAVTLAASATTDTTNAANIGSGTLPAPRLPNPAASALGGVNSKTCTAGQYVNEITTAGAVNCATPAGGDADPTTNLSRFEDFISGTSATSGSLGEWGWFFTTSGSAGRAYQAATAGRPGILQLSTGATSASMSNLYASVAGPSSVHSSDSFDLAISVKLGQVDANSTARAGLYCQASLGNAQPTDGVYFEHLEGDTANWYGVTRASSAETRTASVGTADTNWVRLRVWRSDASTISFSVNGAAAQTSTTNIPSGGCHPWFMIVNSTTASKTMNIDYAWLKVTGLSR